MSSVVHFTAGEEPALDTRQGGPSSSMLAGEKRNVYVPVLEGKFRLLHCPATILVIILNELSRHSLMATFIWKVAKI